MRPGGVVDAGVRRHGGQAQSGAQADAVPPACLRGRSPCQPTFLAG
jgi:hypothetical protein